MATDSSKEYRVNLSGQNLRGKDLTQTSLRRANLSRSDLSRSDLSGVDLSGANLYRANLTEANLRGANLHHTYLSETILIKANFIKANLKEAFLGRSNLYRANFNEANLNGANLNGANLNGANLTKANLSEVNLSEVNIKETNFKGANFKGANLGRHDLNMSNFAGADLSKADLSGVALTEVDLSGVNLGGQNFSHRDLTGTNLTGANLRNANFQVCTAISTNFNRADFTGACIKDWNINSETNLKGVICDYVYLGENQQERRPSDPNQSFKLGEFTKLFQEALKTVDLIFTDGIDWKAFFLSFQEVRAKYDDENLSIQAIEKKRGGVFVVRLEIPLKIDKAEIEQSVRELYFEQLNHLEAIYQAQLCSQAYSIKYERQRNSQLMRMVEVMAENTGPKYDLRNANIGNLANTVEDNARQQANQYNYTLEQQPLAEASAEIQRLLKQLEQTNPNATLEQKKAFVDIGVSPTLKQRAVGAFKFGGKAIIEKVLDNPYISVGIAIIEGWKEGQ